MKNRGYVTLLSVLVLGAVGVSVAVSVVLLGVGASRTSFANEQSMQARALASACGEEALQQIRNSTSFSGSNSLTLGQGGCSYTVTNTGGTNRTIRTNRTITSTGTVGSIVRKASLAIDAVNPQINVVSWQEVSDL